MRRRFNGGQRVALFIAAHGRCSECGAPLARGWHADHIQPFAFGGQTDLTNGRALCPSCNQRKGAGGMRRISTWPTTDTLRDWQEHAVNRYTESAGRDFLVQATPGSGKTLLALYIAHQELSAAAVERIVVVVPTQSLRKQWADKASAVGLSLDPEWASDQGGEMADFHGIVVTYQAVAANPDMQRFLCQRRTLVIFDEIHHAGDSLAWGENIRHAFEPATLRLALTGTPFRTDNRAIPFIRYRDGYCDPDVEYSYGRALADGVCRPIVFPSNEGDLEWLSGGKVFQAAFHDDIPDEEASRRLRTALDVNGSWLRDVLRQADDELSRIRRDGHPDAGGLVVCVDQAHAKGIGRLLHQITGEDPAIVISEDPGATDKIRAYTVGHRRWLIAVKMVSEGVDIPRLRVGVYATTTITELFFRQFVGRFVRKLKDVEEQVATIYLPAEDKLLEYAQRIKQECAAAIREIEQRIRETLSPSDREQPAPLFLPKRAEALPGPFVHDDLVFGIEELEQARELGRIGSFMSDNEVARLAKVLRVAKVPAPATARGTTSSQTRDASVYERREMLRSTRKARISQLANDIRRVCPWSVEEVFKTINVRLAQQTGARAGEATVEQLLRQTDLLQQWRDGLLRAREVGAEVEWFDSWIGGGGDARSLAQ